MKTPLSELMRNVVGSRRDYVGVTVLEWADEVAELEAEIASLNRLVNLLSDDLAASEQAMRETLGEEEPGDE